MSHTQGKGIDDKLLLVASLIFAKLVGSAKVMSFDKMRDHTVGNNAPATTKTPEKNKPVIHPPTVKKQVDPDVEVMLGKIYYRQNKFWIREGGGFHLLHRDRVFQKMCRKELSDVVKKYDKDLQKELTRKFTVQAATHASQWYKAFLHKIQVANITQYEIILVDWENIRAERSETLESEEDAFLVQSALRNLRENERPRAKHFMYIFPVYKNRNRIQNGIEIYVNENKEYENKIIKTDMNINWFQETVDNYEPRAKKRQRGRQQGRQRGRQQERQQGRQQGRQRGNKRRKGRRLSDTEIVKYMCRLRF